MRAVVVGASTGLGRCLGIGLTQRGAQVALLARRKDKLDTAVEEAGDGALAVVCDVTDADSARAGIEQAVAGLGGIDALLYCTGMGALCRIDELTPAVWNDVFATNVVGANEMTRFALPHLRQSGGMAAYLSSVSASLTSPWPGLASYTVTKAALDKLVDAWRAEHHEIGFTRIIVGECAGGAGDGVSQLMAGWDAELTGELFGVWSERGLITSELMDVDHFVDAVYGVIRCGATTTMPSVSITPRRPI